MNPSDLDALPGIIIRAKQATYVAGAKSLLPYRLGSHDIQWSEGDWAYHDSYLGENDFIGQEAIYYRRKVVWAMNYFGRILDSAQITSEQAGQVIQASLSCMYAEGRFLGGFMHHVGDYTYVDSSEGDFRFFTGREQITRQGKVVYELIYHGGLIKD